MPTKHDAGPRLDSGGNGAKEHYWDNRWNLNTDCGLDCGTGSMLNFLVW